MVAVSHSIAQLPPRLPPHPPPRAEDRTKLGWVIAGTFIALLGCIALFAMGGGGSYPDVKARDAAIVGTGERRLSCRRLLLAAQRGGTCFWVEETFDRNAPIEKTADKS